MGHLTKIEDPTPPERASGDPGLQMVTGPAFRLCPDRNQLVADLHPKVPQALQPDTRTNLASARSKLTPMEQP